MSPRVVAAFLVGAGLVAACATAPAPLPSRAASQTASPTTSPAASPGIESVVVGGERPVVVIVPPGYDPATPAPLLVVLHGYTASGVATSAYLGLGPVAAARGMLYAYPDGTLDRETNRFWNASDACCNFHGSDVDDSAYLAGLVEEISRVLSVDRARVFFAGHSNGGFMSFRMACDHADVVAAIASLAGSTPTDATCAPSGPVAVLQIHGSADDTIRYDGGRIYGHRYPGAVETVQTWAAHDGCEAQGVAGPSLLDLDAGLTGPGGGLSETRVETWSSGCQPGGHAELWTVEGGAHSPNLTPVFAEAVVDFLLAHPKPGDGR